MLEFFQFTQDTSDIHRIPTVHMVETHFLLENPVNIRAILRLEAILPYWKNSNVARLSLI